MKNTTKYLSLVLALLMALSLCACAAPAAPAAEQPATAAPDAATPAAADSAEPQVLRVAGESWHMTKLLLEDAAKNFMDAHPNVKVELVTYADSSVLSTYSLDWGNASTDVDLVFLDGTFYAQQFAAKDLIFDWEKDLQFFDSYDASRISDGIVDYGRINGNLYLLPIIYEVYGVDINLDMFKAAGLVDAQGNPLMIETWQDFYDFAKTLTVVDDKGNVVQEGASINFGANLLSVIASALTGRDGTFLAADGVSFNFDSEGFREILSIWRQGVADGYFSIATFADTSAGRNNYKAGNVAMIFESASRWIEGDEMLGEGVCSVLPCPGLKGTTGNTNGVVIPRCSPNAELAKQFVQEQLLGETVQTGTLNGYGKLPVVAEYYAMADSPIWSNLDVQMGNAPSVPAYEEINRFKDELVAIMQDGLVNQDKSVDDVVAELVEMSDSIRK